MSGLRGISVPVGFEKFEESNGIESESFSSLPIFLRFEIPFCSMRDEESMLTPNKRLLCGSLAPWYAVYSLPGNGGRAVRSETFVCGGPNCSTWGSTLCTDPDEIWGSTEICLGNIEEEDIPFWDNEPNMLWIWETSDEEMGFATESGKFG